MYAQLIWGYGKDVSIFGRPETTFGNLPPSGLLLAAYEVKHTVGGVVFVAMHSGKKKQNKIIKCIINLVLILHRLL